MLKRAGVKILGTSHIYSLLLRRAHRHQPVTILCYHTLRRDTDRLDSWLALRLSDFRAQLEIFRRQYDIVSLDDALGPPRGAKPRLVLTFDDGEMAMHELLLPLVEAEQIPVTVYVATGQIETGRSYWFDRVVNALQGNQPVQIDLAAQGLGRWQIGADCGPARWSQLGAILEALKSVPEHERDRLANQVVAQGAPPPNDVTPCRPMHLYELKELAAHPLVTIGAHSHGHELLDGVPLADAMASVVQSRDLLANWTGQDIRHFAYPNGNYTDALMVALAELGFRSAAILSEALAPADVPPMALPRISVGRYDSLTRLRLRMVGL